MESLGHQAHEKAGDGDHFEIGYDRRFEKSWYVAEVVGRLTMAAFATAALLGLFGRGPLGHATRSDRTHAISVDFEPIVRYRTPTIVTLRLRNSSSSERLASVVLDRRIVKPMGLLRTIPAPLRAVAGNDAVVFQYALAPSQSEVLVRLQLRPSAIGPVRLRAYEGAAGVTWSMFVVP